MRPEDGRPLDELRVFKEPHFLSVYVPPTPPPHPDDWKRDFPPGYPPEVHYNGVQANYWVVLCEGNMLFWGRDHKFSEDEMTWLRSIEQQVREMLPY